MAITLLGVASTPADNGTNTTATTAVTPVGSMLAGDLVILFGLTRDSAGVSFAISATGGQTWDSGSPATTWSATNISGKAFFCRYDGTWAANPSIAVTGGTSPYSVVMLVFRPTLASNTWSRQGFGGSNAKAGGAGQVMPVNPGTGSIVSLAFMAAPAANTYSNLTGLGGWAVAGSAQYRNTSGSDQAITFAYSINNTAGDDPTIDQALGPTAGFSSFLIFNEIAAPITGDLSQSIGEITAAATGTLAISGSLASSIGEITTTSAGKLALSASLASSIGEIALGSAGTLAIKGSLSQSIGEIALAAAGTVASATPSGTLSQSIGEITLAATGALRIAGTLTASIGTIGLTATGKLAIAGVLSKSIGEITLSAAGELAIAGVLSKSIGEIALVSAGSLRITGALIASIGQITLAATGTTPAPSRFYNQAIAEIIQVLSAAGIEDRSSIARVTGASFAQVQRDSGSVTIAPADSSVRIE